MRQMREEHSAQLDHLVRKAMIFFETDRAADVVHHKMAAIDPECVDEMSTDFGVATKRLRLASGAVESKHEQSPEALAKRMLTAECVEFVNGFRITALREIRFGSGFAGHHGEFFEMSSLGACKLCVGEVDERLATSKL